ncbi:tRNA modification GTPase TrmE [Candidatus Omnitrophus magneticus]|uniref:tRNA modification GTPase MnmE n=1 Tax=Candidatus Omnitrophus magneticus TaxID=1609969 RepID=A0A0F0CVU6_9BACT|nr:tRNA modification GTPase TrmE [Candidatus Omnitrophus magneticus]
MNKKNDTIAAISTPLGEGGIGIVRLSGNDAFAVVSKIFFSKNSSDIFSYKTGTIHFGYIKDIAKGEIIDEVLLSVMRAPKTYTKENIVEINCHGGALIVQMVLDVCISSGARLAEPGEFTKRAFLNGRIDLSQAEAVIDIIKSESEICSRMAMENLQGKLSRDIREIRELIINILAEIELSIDFTEEDVEFSEQSRITGKIKTARNKIKDMLASGSKGMMIKRGVKAVICGRPNVGKSSLMNALLRHERVIVAERAGTTRDVVEDALNIKGISVRLYDTAGIMETSDAIEIESIKRTKQKIDSADIALFVLDAGAVISQEDRLIFETIKNKNKVIILNKIDMPLKINEELVKKEFNMPDACEVSSLTGKGIENLEEIVFKMIAGNTFDKGHASIIARVRHKECLENALISMNNADKTINEGFNLELIASDLNSALYELGLITGEIVDDSILDKIFSEFCIGK